MENGNLDFGPKGMLPIQVYARELGTTLQTVYRWAKGIRRPANLRLDVLRIGGKTFVTKEAHTRFVNGCNPERAAASQPEPVPA